MIKDNRYVERQFIAGGRFSSVFKAKDQGDGGKLVALKITTPEDDRPPHNSRDEKKLLELLDSKEGLKHNVVPLLECFESEGIDLVMVFPYFPFTLTQLLKHSATKVRPRVNPYLAISDSSLCDTDSMKPTYENNLTLNRAKQIIIGIANGLSFLHQNKIIHRDIKPANIMFKNFGSDPIIIDFGISYTYPSNYGKEDPDNKICDIATSIYKAPELLFRITDYSYGVDIWSFGILITSLFSKDIEPVFNTEDLTDLRLVWMIFETFGVPTLKTWPEAKKSNTFGALNLTEKEPKSLDEILPRADEVVKDIFKEMMVYDSKNRISADRIVKLLHTKD